MFKPKKTGNSFAGERNNYIEYTSEGDDNENLSPQEYLNIIRSYLIGLINNYKTSGEWKIQLIMINKCLSSKNFKETRSVSSTSNNIEIFMGSDTDEVIDLVNATINPKNINDDNC